MGVLSDANAVINKFTSMRRAGAETVQAAANSGAEVAQKVAVFAEGYPEWVADGGLEEAGHISFYPGTGMAYMCANAIQRFEHYTPDVATNNYNPYPEPNDAGVYPYVWGMTVWTDMLVRDTDGTIYRCILPSGTYKLVYEPKDVPSIFELEY